MSLVSHTIPHVPDSESVRSLSTRAANALSPFFLAVSAADGHWRELSEVFLVSGAEGAPEMLAPLVESGMQFSMHAITPLMTVLESSAREFESLKTRRDRLVERMATLNSTYERVIANRNDMFRRYEHAQGSDDDGQAARIAETNLAWAQQDVESVTSAAEYFAVDVATFVADLEAEERSLGSNLASAAGSGRVVGPNGNDISTTQYHWGVYSTPYPGSTHSTQRTLASNLELALGSAVAAKIRELGYSSQADMRDWLATHPDFMSSITFIPPETAQRLYEGFAEDSRMDGHGSWMSGPLAALLLSAPGLIGNLNGISAAEKNRFNSVYLAQLIYSGETDPETVARLQDLQAALKAHPESTLQSVFLDSDGKPRASLGFGDLDNATQINTVTHGIETGLHKEGNITEWSNVSQSLLDNLRAQNDYTNAGGEPAMLLFFEWDSGDKHNVWGIERPNAGAERLNALVGGYEFRNPSIQQNMIVHSLGTTNGGQAAVARPEMWDNVYFVGSAGITELSSDKLEKQIADGQLNVFATHAKDDFVAPFGRNDWFFNSEHPVDPRKVDGVNVYGSDGNQVPNFLTDEGAMGGRVEGHNSAESEEWLYRIFRPEITYLPDGNVLVEYPDRARGYLDEDAESFMHLIVKLSGATSNE